MGDSDYNYYGNSTNSLSSMLRNETVEQDERLARDIQMALDLQEQENQLGEAETMDQLYNNHSHADNEILGQSGFAVQDLNRLDHMLFITAEVEGRLVEMLVDSGASASCVSFAMVDFLGLNRYFNSNVRGEATGAGKARIVGLLENVKCQIGHVEFRLYFMVLDTQRPYLILGLDQLKRFKCVIDLQDNHLLFGGRDGVSTPFLDRDLAQAAAERRLPTTITSTDDTTTNNNTTETEDRIQSATVVRHQPGEVASPMAQTAGTAASSLTSDRRQTPISRLASLFNGGRR